MRIALVANTSWYVFNFRRNLIRTLQNAGHEVFVIAPHDDYVQKLIQLGVKHCELTLSRRGTNPFSELAACIRLFRLIRAIKPRVILTFTVKCNLYTGICRRFLEFDQIANISGLGEAFEKKGLINYVVSRLYKWALHKSWRVFFQNHEDITIITERGLLSQQQCKRIPGSGVDLMAYHPSPNVSSNIPPRFLMFGRLLPEKGYDLFIKAAENIRLKHNCDAEFWIMGIVDTYRKESTGLLERILAMQNRGILKYLPASDDVAAVLQKVDVVVLPSRYHEGVPRSLLEAMASGKPIITTDWKGCRDTVDHGSNGFLVPVNDYGSLEHYILKLINTPSHHLEAMGRASRRKAETEFDENQVLHAYTTEIHESILEDVLCLPKITSGQVKRGFGNVFNGRSPHYT